MILVPTVTYVDALLLGFRHGELMLSQESFQTSNARPVETTVGFCTDCGRKYITQLPHEIHSTSKLVTDSGMKVDVSYEGRVGAHAAGK